MDLDTNLQKNQKTGVNTRENKKTKQKFSHSV